MRIALHPLEFTVILPDDYGVNKTEYSFAKFLHQIVYFKILHQQPYEIDPNGCKQGWKRD